jgi:thiamine phosphate synthase YjbQ (UPF0047 family)
MTEIKTLGKIDENGYLKLDTPLAYRNKSVKIIVLVEDNEIEISSRRSGFGTWQGIELTNDFDAPLDDLKDYMPQ